MFPEPEISVGMTAEEGKALVEAVGDRQTALEIGSAFGYSTILLAEPWRIVPRVVLSVDPHQDYNSWEGFLANLDKYSALGRVLPFRATNKQLLPYLGDSSVDFAFIDGDHSYEGCLYDLLNCLRVVRPGGAIAVHDYCQPRIVDGNDGNLDLNVGFPGVRRAVDEHLRTYPNRLFGTLFIAEV